MKKTLLILTIILTIFACSLAPIEYPHIDKDEPSKIWLLINEEEYYALGTTGYFYWDYDNAYIISGKLWKEQFGQDDEVGTLELRIPRLEKTTFTEADSPSDGIGKQHIFILSKGMVTFEHYYIGLGEYLGDTEITLKLEYMEDDVIAGTFSGKAIKYGSNFNAGTAEYITVEGEFASAKANSW